MKKWSKSSSIRSSKRTDVVDYGDERQPRKTLIRMLSSNYKHVDVNQQLQKMFTCNKCNKGFPSSKALCGHMACHSVKEKALMKKNHNHVMNNKCKKLDEAVVAAYSNCSSEASGVEQEQEEDVAICLMMLSRDSCNWGGLNPFNETYKATNQCSKAVIIHGRSHRGFNDNVAENHHKRFKAESTQESEENKSDEVSAIFKGDGTLLHDFIDLNLPAPPEDEASN